MTAARKTYTHCSSVRDSSHIATTKSLTALVLAFFAASLDDLGPYFLEELKQFLWKGMRSICDRATPLVFKGDGRATTGASTVVSVVASVVGVVDSVGSCSSLSAEGNPATSSSSWWLASE